MEDVLERVNKLESMFEFEPYDTSNETVQTVDINPINENNDKSLSVGK